MVEMKHHGYCPPSVGVAMVRLMAHARHTVMKGEALDVAVAQLVATAFRLGYGDIRDAIIRDSVNVNSLFNLASYRGYCYLWLVRPEHRITMSIAMGPSPTVMSLMRWHDTRVWAVSDWGDLVISPGGIADFHIEPSGFASADSVSFIDALLYMQASSAGSLSEFWKTAAVPQEFLCKLNRFSTIGAPKIQKLDMAEKIADAYRKVLPSVGNMLRRIIFRGEFAVIASLYKANGFPDVSEKTLLTGTHGRAVVQYPPATSNGLFLLPPGFYYIGEGFRIGSEDVCTVMLVSEGVSMRVCSEESRFRADLPDPASFGAYYRDCSSPGHLRKWWEFLHSAGKTSDGHFVRTQSNVLIHSVETVVAASGTCVEVTEPLDDNKSLEIYRYSGVVDANGVCQVGCAQVAPFTVLTGFRSTANAELVVGNGVYVQEPEARIALSTEFPTTMTIVDSRHDDTIAHQKSKVIKFSFLLENVADPYSYDYEYDSDCSIPFDPDNPSPLEIEGTSNWYEDGLLPPYSLLNV